MASPPRGLICEDEVLIAFELQDCLEDAGMIVAGSFRSCADALAWLSSDTPCFAILDFRLADGACTELIRLLKARNVPVLIYSGLPQRGHDITDDLGDLTWLSKPLDCSHILKALRQAMPGRAMAQEHRIDGPLTAQQRTRDMMIHTEQAPVRARGAAHLLLQRLSALAPLGAPERQALAEVMTRNIIAERDQTLAVPGQATTECRVLLSGLAAAHKLLPDGTRQIIGFVPPGHFLDLEAYVTGALDYGVTACSPCSVAVIPHAELRGLTSEYPDITHALWRDTLLNAAIHREWVVNVGQRTANERLGHLICEMAARLHSLGLARENEEERSFTWSVTQADIADATGLSTVHVNRTLQELRGRELIEFRHKEMTVLDWPRLKSFSGFDPGYLSPAEQRTNSPLQ